MSWVICNMIWLAISNVLNKWWLFFSKYNYWISLSSLFYYCCYSGYFWFYHTCQTSNNSVESKCKMGKKIKVVFWYDVLFIECSWNIKKFSKLLDSSYENISSFFHFNFNECLTKSADFNLSIVYVMCPMRHWNFPW